MALSIEEVSQLHTDTLFDRLAEESAEFIQAIMKIKRFGTRSYRPGSETNNLQDAMSEYSQIALLWMEFLNRSGGC